MPDDTHVVNTNEKVWICTECNRVWPVEGVPVCTICKAFAIECKYCGVWKPDYECFNVEFHAEGDEGKEFVGEAEEICDICLMELCKAHNIELNFELLDTVADEIKNGSGGYGKADEEDIL